jgi:hypothetical protein
MSELAHGYIRDGRPARVRLPEAELELEPLG